MVCKSEVGGAATLLREGAPRNASCSETSIGGFDQVLFELAVGVSIGGEAQALAGIYDLEGAQGHAAAELFAGLAKGDGLAKRAEAVAEVGDCLGAEVVV